MQDLIKQLTELRVLVGFLGEKHNASWWSSEFYSPNAPAFLTHIFTRSLSTSQYTGVVAAAARVHDDAIGIGAVYHLFRLPLEVEQSVLKVMQNKDFIAEITNNLINEEEALKRLKQLASEDNLHAEGACLLESPKHFSEQNIALAAALYYSSFVNHSRVYPFFRAA